MLVAVGLSIAIAATYGSVGSFGFVSYDDPEYISANPVVQRGLSVEGVRYAFTSVHHGNSHPLTTLSNMLDIDLFGMNPGAMSDSLSEGRPGRGHQPLRPSASRNWHAMVV